MKKYWIQDREAGKIEWFNSEIEAEEQIERYETEDREAGIYEPNFYEIEEEVIFTAEEIAANFDHIYIISVPHQMPCRKLTFWSDDEIVSYANEYRSDCDAETVQDAIDCISADWNTCKVIRNIEDCFNAWKSATHKAGEIHKHIIDIMNDETEVEFEDYAEAEKFFEVNKRKDDK